MHGLEECAQPSPCAGSSHDRMADDRRRVDGVRPDLRSNRPGSHAPRGHRPVGRHSHRGAVASMAMRGFQDDRGQTATEYLMIAGLLTAIIISLTSTIVPTIGYVVVSLVKHMSFSLSSVSTY